MSLYMDADSCAAFAGAIPLLLLTGILESRWVAQNRQYGTTTKKSILLVFIYTAVFGLVAALLGTMRGGWHGYTTLLVLVPTGISLGAFLLNAKRLIERSSESTA